MIDKKPEGREHCVERTARFIDSYQIQALCEALRFALQTGNTPGPAAIEVLSSIRKSMSVIIKTDGPQVDRVPDVTSEMSAVDLLAIAEVMRATYLAFLSPEELEEQSDTFGFHTVC